MGARGVVTEGGLVSFCLNRLALNRLLILEWTQGGNAKGDTCFPHCASCFVIGRPSFYLGGEVGSKKSK